MKQKILLLCTLFWCMLMSFGQTLDQSNTPTVTPFGGNVFNLTIEGVNGENPGQTFTAGTTNVLSRVAVQLTNAANDFVAGTFQLNVYAGTNVAAAPLNTTNFTISTAPPTNAYQEFEINLSPTLAITSGSVYTFTIRGIGSAKVGVCSVNINGYPGGHANIYSSELTGYDLWFKTYVGAIASNSAPTDITLSATSVNENVAANTTVGTLSSTDSDVGNTFTYSLVAGTGSTDNASFNISGSSLRITNSPDFETKSSYAIRLRTTDQGGLFFEKQFTITINNVNETPTDIALSSTAVNENVAANTTIGTLGSTDPDAGNTFTYTLVAGTGSTDNASFNISGSNLRITNSPNFETKSSYAIRLRTTDQGGLFFEKQFIITINNVNETPTDIALSSTAVNENVAANTTVGTLSSTDPDTGNTFTYTLVAGTGSTDNASFNISGTSLRITNSPDFETKSSYAIRLRTTDQGGLFFEKQYTITINDLVESTTSATHLNFDGVDDLVNCGATLNTVLDPLNTITVEAWVRPSTNTGLGVIIGNYANSNQSSMQFLLRRENNSYGFWIQGDGTFKNVTAINAVVLNTWQHVAGVWNGSDLKIYINGVLSAVLAGVNDSSFATTTNAMIIGNNQFSGNPEEFTGSIDEVRIWSSAKTIEQINGSKNCELQGTESGLLAYYNFNQGIDQANNSAVTTLTATTGPNGTLTNFALNGSVSNWLAGSPVTTGSIVPSVATVTTPVVYIQGDTASALTATTGANGTGLLWYTTATGGVGSTTAPAPSTATVGNTSYWVSSTNANGCESERVEIVVTVNTPVSATHLNFDGTSDFVNLSASSINNASQGTIEAWIYPTATVLDNQTICSKQSNFENSYATLTLGGSTAPNGRLFYQSKNGASIISTATLTANQWTHIAVTFNNSQAKIYINGVLDNTVSGDFSLPNDTSVTATSIGAWLGDGGGQYFKGNIDEFRFWNTLRTAEQIFGSKNCELQGTETGLVTYYKFNQGIDQANNSAVTTLTATTGSNATLTSFALNGSVSNWLAGSPVTTGSIIPSVATVTTPVVYTQGDTASQLTATVGANGTGLLWYTTATGGVGSAAPTPSTATVGNTSYWVSSTNANGCESGRVEIVVTVNAPALATHLNFDGLNDFVVSTNAVTSNTESQTYQAWFRIPSIPANSDTILLRGNDGSGGWSVQVGINSTGILYAGISASPDTFVTGTTVLIPNTWYQTTFVFENNNSLRLYLNGNLEASTAIGNRTLRNSDNRLRIGSGNIASEYFSGDIDEVRVWNKVLNATDILNTMNCELQATETGLVAYYKFNQGNDSVNNSTVNSLLDSSSNANNGTLTGFALTGTTSNWRSGSTITTGNTCATLGNSDFENVTSITIYPNPSTGIFNIVSQQNVSVLIYDLLGKLVYNQSIVNGTNSIDISNFNAGVYLLKATDANGNTETHKLIKN